jgi:hypothetical protein
MTMAYLGGCLPVFSAWPAGQMLALQRRGSAMGAVLGHRAQLTFDVIISKIV